MADRKDRPMERLRCHLPERLQGNSRSDLGRATTENHLSPPSGTSPIGEAPWFALTLTTIYALVLSFALFHHEMWRNEIQAWLLARDSADVFELFRNLKYEGHPGLWHLLLMPVTRLTNSPVGMQVLHLIIATITIFIVAKYAPFSMLQKSLFAFGYFPLYEYGVISRNYALGLLFVVVTCVLLRQRWRHPLWLALILFLMSHTSVHACIIAISVTFGLALDYWLNRRALAADAAVDVRRIHTGLAIVCGGILLSVLQMYPAVDFRLGGGGDGIERFMALMQRSFFSPDFSIVTKIWIHSWGVEVRSLQELYGVYACAFLATIVIYSRSRPVAQAVFLCCCTGLLHFFVLISGGSLRHYGFFMIALLLLIWGGRYLTDWAHREDTPTKGDGASFGGRLVTGLLAIHAVSGLNAVAVEIEHPYSLGKRAAEYIQAENLDSLPMIGEADFASSTVVGYLKRKRTIHYVRGNREGSFIRWDIRRDMAVDDRSLLSQARALADRTGDKVLMILNRRLSSEAVAQRRVRRLASFTGAKRRDEEYHLYLHKSPSPPG